MTESNKHPVYRKRHDPIQLITKIILAAVFILGAALIFMGHRAHEKFTGSGFSSEAAFRSIYYLSRGTADAWKNKLNPELNKIPDAERSSIDQITAELLKSSWENQQKGAGAEAEALAEDPELAYKLLNTAYLVNGPKVSAANRKAAASLTGDAASDFRSDLLKCLTDGEAPLPSEARKAVEGLEGSERQAMLMQLFFISSGSTENRITENVNTLKKTVRGKSEQLTAYRMIADGEISWLWQIFISNSRTVILIGIILMLDNVLLALLMNADRRWEFDLKWIMILLIVDFLLFF